MKGLSKKEIILLVVLLVVIIIALYYYYFYRPMQEDMAALNSEIQQNQTKLDDLNTKQQTIARAEEEILRLQSGLNDSLSDIPTGIDEPELLVFIEDSVRGLSEDVTIAFNATPELTEYYQIKTVVVTLSTTYDHLKTILSAFENAPCRNVIMDFSAAYLAAEDSMGPVTDPSYEPGRDTVAEELYGSEQAQSQQQQQKSEMTLRVKMNVEFISFVGEIPQKNYPFMTGTYYNPELFIK